MGKKILLNEHADEAQAYIQKLETRLIPALRYIQDKAKALGVELPAGKDSLFDIAQGKFDDLKSKYWQQNFKDVEQFQGDAARKQMENIVMERFWDATRQIALRFSETIEGRPLSDQQLLCYIDLDETGRPYIPKWSREEIQESFREYLVNPRHVKCYEAQLKLAKALDEFAEAANSIGLIGALPPGFIATKFFDVSQDEKNLMHFTPRPLDYSAEEELARLYEQ